MGLHELQPFLFGENIPRKIAFNKKLRGVKLYKGALLKAGVRPATIARRLSVLRGTYRQFAAKGLIDWESAQDIAAMIVQS